MRKSLLSLFFILVIFKSQSQSKFQFYGSKDIKQKVKFTLINNLIIIPLKINDKELNFILDTGVNKTILFNLSKNDSLGLNDVEKIQLKGLGSGDPVDALLSRNNRFRINDLVNPNEDLYVILRDNFNISAKMGMTIHGIIGFDLLKNVIVKIDYANRYLTFYNPKKYDLKKCRRCEEFRLEFYRNKPYINTYAQLDTLGNRKIPTKLLIDSGGSDALWFFEGTHNDILTPKKYFRDILGEGLSGTIYGNRSKIPSFKLGRFKIENPTVSFLDTTSTANARQFRLRNGSIGGNILKRFKVWLDYGGRRVIFKKSGSLKRGFYYNMSGLSVIYDGQELVKEKQNSISMDGLGSGEVSDNKTISFVTSYFYRFKPAYKVSNVLEGSPAYLVGLEKDDVIKRINGNPAYTYTLSQINGLFQERPEKRITLEIERAGQRYKYRFRLKKRI
ncbi:retropepsin-like aspartic protease [Tenacibaculum sp. SZ-18]|uniref:retropepsin-like aspartic protease n=1 Tax=Tenacibaculum sp. SZ-18 TaxID=754423 RepID=UPI000C2D66A4|nr:aspartyl protease family protein [Tenacibaculum sp. SZ-18]